MGTIGGGDDAFCLKWNDYQKSVASSFAELRHDKVLSDVTVVCEGVHIPAHRVILSACSGAFKELFTPRHSSSPKLPKEPVVMMWDVKSSDMEALFNFMYEGQVNVSQDRLNSFLSLAERLQVKGLTNNDNNSSSTAAATPNSSSANQKRKINSAISSSAPRPLSKKPKSNDDEGGSGARSHSDEGGENNSNSRGEPSKGKSENVSIKLETRMMEEDDGDSNDKNIEISNAEHDDVSYNDVTGEDYHESYYDETEGETTYDDPIQGTSGADFSDNADATKVHETELIIIGEDGFEDGSNNPLQIIPAAKLISATTSNSTTPKDKMPCPICHKLVTCVKRHVEDIHQPNPTPCPECGIVFSSKNKMASHKSRNCKVKKQRVANENLQQLLLK